MLSLQFECPRFGAHFLHSGGTKSPHSYFSSKGREDWVGAPGFLLSDQVRYRFGSNDIGKGEIELGASAPKMLLQWYEVCLHPDIIYRLVRIGPAPEDPLLEHRTRLHYELAKHLPLLRDRRDSHNVGRKHNQRVNEQGKAKRI